MKTSSNFSTDNTNNEAEQLVNDEIVFKNAMTRDYRAIQELSLI